MFGTFLGVLLIGVISQALVYLKIPTAWMDAFAECYFYRVRSLPTLEDQNKQIIFTNQVIAINSREFYYQYIALINTLIMQK
jgi:hypothetical protein